VFRRGSRHHHRQMETIVQCEPDGGMAVEEQPAPQISRLDLRDVRGKRKLCKAHIFCRVECRIDPSCDDA